ncbi:hypothetical protein KXD40_003743 [Peronospora effusa]|nr:hypothetical protein KXD40_003743 [Peronospora effusa]
MGFLPVNALIYLGQDQAPAILVPAAADPLHTIEFPFPEETKLSSSTSLADNDYSLHAADANACSFWSNQSSGAYRPRNGVALIFSGVYPFQTFAI